MYSRNNDCQTKFKTFQLNQVKPDDSTAPLADTMEIDQDIDEWKIQGRHKVGDLKNQMGNLK